MGANIQLCHNFDSITLCTFQFVMCVFLINYKSIKFPIVQLVYLLCKTIDNMKQLNDNKWQIKGLSSTISS
jgi:hypothetical protein